MIKLTKFIKRYSNILITLFVLGVIAYFIQRNTESLKAVIDVSMWVLLLLALLKASFIYVNGKLLDIVLNKYGKKISNLETFYISTISSAGNYFGPLLGGTSIRAVYLKKKHNLSYSKFLSALASYYSLLFLVVGVLAIVSLAFLHAGGTTVHYLSFMFFSSLIIATLSLAFVRKQIPNKLRSKLPSRLDDALSQIIKGWIMIRNDPILLKRLLFLSLFNISIQASIVWVEFSLFAENYSLANVLVYTSISLVAILFALTPGAIGIRETLLLLSTATIGLTSANVLEIALIDRGVSLVVLSVLLLLSRSNRLRETIVNHEYGSG